MKILKRPENVIYDTENPDAMEFNPIELDTICHWPHLESPNSMEFKPCPLHLLVPSEWDYLTEYFKAKKGIQHPIFQAFGQSYFYCLEE